MNTIADLQSAMIEAQAQAEEWEQEFQEEWNAPLILAEQTMAFLSATPAERMALMESDKALHDKLVMNVTKLVRRLAPQVQKIRSYDGPPN